MNMVRVIIVTAAGRPLLSQIYGAHIGDSSAGDDAVASRPVTTAVDGLGDPTHYMGSGSMDADFLLAMSVPADMESLAFNAGVTTTLAAITAALAGSSVLEGSPFTAMANHSPALRFMYVADDF